MESIDEINMASIGKLKRTSRASIDELSTASMEKKNIESIDELNRV